MTRFLFERQQLPDGSMPRNSLTNGKPAPDSLQHPARRVRLPAGHGARRRADRPRLLHGPHPPGGELRRQPRAVVRPGALGGAGRLLALDDLGRDRRACSPRRRSPTATATATRRRLARRRRRVPAQPEDVDADHQRPAERRSRTSSASRRPATRTRRSPTTSATAARRSTSARSSTPASSSTRGSACCKADDAGHRRARWRSSTRRSSATTASGDGFLRYNGDGYGDGVDRRPPVGAVATRATATSGRCSPASAASRSSTAATRRRGRRARWRRWRRWAPASA